MQNSLFATIGFALFELVLRFEDCSRLKREISDDLIRKIKGTIGWLASLNSEFAPSSEYISKMLSILTDKQKYDYATRVEYLSYYFSNQGIPEVVRDFIHFLMIQRLEGNFQDQLINMQMDFQLAMEIIRKIAEIFQIAIFLFKDDRTYEKIYFSDFQLPLVYLQLRNNSEVIILYSGEMIAAEQRSNLETILPKLVFEKVQITDLYKEEVKIPPVNQNLPENFRQPIKRIDNLTQLKLPENPGFSGPSSNKTRDSPQKAEIFSLSSSVNLNSKEINSSEDLSSKFRNQIPVPVPKHSGAMNNPNHLRNPSGSLPSYFSEKQVNQEIPPPNQSGIPILPPSGIQSSPRYPQPSPKASNLENKPGPVIKSSAPIPEANPIPEAKIPTHVPIPSSHISQKENFAESQKSSKLPNEIISFINYISNVISSHKVYDEGLQEKIKKITLTFPEIGPLPSTLICSVKSPVLIPKNSDNLKEKPIFNPVVKPQERESVKTCEKCLKVTENDNFSTFECNDCSKICNFCRVKNCGSCIRCGRVYESYEKEILMIMKDSIEKGNFDEEVKKQVVEKTIRAVKRLKKCAMHGGLVEKDLISSDIHCPQGCFVCNQCRVKDTERCVVCRNPYSEIDHNYLLSVKMSLEG
jgi:hypothetical protein